MRIKRPILELSSAHFLIDSYSSMLGAFLPFLHRALNLSLSEAGILGGALVLSSSLAQPLYGYLSDRLQHKAFVAVAPAVTAVFISALGMATTFEALAVLILLGGSGIASFHPQAASMAAGLSGRRHHLNLAFFISSGMLGYALGPTFITLVILTVGLSNSIWAALPGVAMAIYLLWRGPSPSIEPRRSASRKLAALIRPHWRPLLLLYLIVVIRSIIQLVFVSFLPLYFTSQGYAELQASEALSLFLLAGGVAGLLGGFLADRYGGKKILVLSMGGCIPFLLGFLTTGGLLSVTLCSLGGGFLLMTTAVNVAMAQKLVPGGAGTVSALMMGFAWGIGGLLVPVAGWASDIYGLQATLAAFVTVAVPGTILALALPQGRPVPIVGSEA